MFHSEAASLLIIFIYYMSPPKLSRIFINNDQAHDPYIIIEIEEGTDLKLSNVDPPQMSVDGGTICLG